jgi:hypothetical protein
MLEGQVAVLSAGCLSAQEANDVLNSLKSSSLYRKDQSSYLLYPDRQLPRFAEKNSIPREKVSESELLSKLIKSGDTSILSKDDSGNYHFNWRFRNAAILGDALHNLDSETWSTLVSEEKEEILALYEDVFDHHSFTGRSGTFFAYEGLGSIYWHMVSKLLLATQECYFRGLEEKDDLDALDQIKAHYVEIREGLGLHKSPELYGAFPTDAYSHTPGTAGAQQPGMTGQVKEDFLCRMRELGIHIDSGNLVIKPDLLNKQELLDQECMFEYFDTAGERQEIILKSGQFGFTFCQVPFIYTASAEDRTIITYCDGKEESYPGKHINQETASELFNRSGKISRIALQIII